MLKGPKPLKGRFNEQITEPSVIVIDEHGFNKGLQSTRDILSSLNLLKQELREVGKKDEHIICRIGLRPVLSTTRSTELKPVNSPPETKESSIKVKELRITTAISDHDLSYKIDHVKEFLKKGYHVRLYIRGKEDDAVSEGKYPEKKRMYDKVYDQVKGLCKLKSTPKYSAQSVDVVLIGHGEQE